MKNKGVTILSIITNIILIAILCSFIKINGSIIKEKQIIKEMSESTQVTDLNNQINALNTEHTEYMNYIQTCKAQLARAITDMGIETSENASVDRMAQNIKSITTKGNKKYLIKDGVIQDGLTFTGARNSSGSAKPTATQQTGYIAVSGQGAYTTIFDINNYSYLGARMDKGTTSGMGTFASSTLIEDSITYYTHGSATNPASYLGDLDNKTNAYVGIYIYASASQSLKLYDLWLE